MRRPWLVLVAAGLGLASSSAALSAQTTPVTIDSRSPVLTKDDGGAWSASLGFTNLTDRPITLKARPRDTTDAGCRLTLDHTQLPAAEHSAVNVTVPAGCKVRGDGIDFRLAAKTGATPSVAFVVTATPKPDTHKPEWRALGAFPIILLALLVVALVSLLTASRPLTGELKYLEATWSFRDSWVSNVTVAGGLLAGIFGSSDVVTALLGEDAKSSVALATVGAAVAAALIATGPLVLLATKSKDDYFTLGGFLVASAITLAGAAGELWVIYRSGQKLDLGGWEHKIVFLAAAGFVILALYAIKAVPATIKHGTTAPPAPPPSDTLVAATWIVEALKAHQNIDTAQLEAAIGAVPPDYPMLGASPAVDHPRPRRSALL